MTTQPAGSPEPQQIDSAPLAGVGCPVLTAAVRRVQGQYLTTVSDPAQAHQAAALLAGFALAIDRQRFEFVPPSLAGSSHRLALRLLELLRGEVLRQWNDGSAAASAYRVVRHLARIEDIRTAVEGRAAESLSTPPPGLDALDLLLEVVHDLRSPLSSIMFLAETLLTGRSGGVSPLQQRQLGLIYSAALGLSGVVSDALVFAREGELLTEHEPVPLSISQIQEAVRDIVWPMAEEKGLTLRLLAPQHDRRLGHPLAISRILLNLTTNALKFTDRGVVELTATDTAPSRVELAVRDTGPGIPPEAMEALFQPWRRAKLVPRYSLSSTGLGLAISRRLVAAMGAELRVDTRPGWGTRFHFELELPPVAQTP